MNLIENIDVAVVGAGHPVVKLHLPVQDWD